jgi:hypothetical protein
MLAVSIPKSATFSTFVDKATKCRATASDPTSSLDSPPRPDSSQDRAEVALVIVSMVVKVFEATTNSVSAGSRSRTASCRSAPSTFDTKRTVNSRSVKARSASYAIAGPRSEPPMPMLTTLRMRLPVWPVHLPERTCSAKSAILSSTACTLGTTFSPATSTTASSGARSAVCSTARPSVTLIRSPRNIASRSPNTSVAVASSWSSASVSSVIRCLE